MLAVAPTAGRLRSFTSRPCRSLPAAFTQGCQANGVSSPEQRRVMPRLFPVKVQRPSKVLLSLLSNCLYNSYSQPLVFPGSGRRSSSSKIPALSIEAPITKVINLLVAAQENSPPDVAQALEKVFSFSAVGVAWD